MTFATVKAYGLKGKLLSKKTCQTLAESRNLDELVTRIRNTTYGDEIAKITKPYNSLKLELGLRSRLAEMQYMLMNAVGGSDLLMSYYYKLVFKNIKSILKGKILEKPQDEIESQISLKAEELIQRRDVTIKAVVAKNIEEAITNLKSLKFGNELEKAYSLYRETRLLPVFDVYLDKILYRSIADSIKSTGDLDILRLFGAELDYYNLRNIMRGKFWELDDQQIQDLVVPHTASTPKELLSRMIAADSIQAALNELPRTRYKNLIPPEGADIEMINNFEHNFELFLYNSLIAEFSHMFKFSTVVAITKLYDFEVKNLSSICFAVEQGLPTDTVMSKLVVN